MNIQGLQKLTLLDYPGKTACTIFTGGCNLRCPFCHNAVLVLCPDAEESYREEEILDLLRKQMGSADSYKKSNFPLFAFVFFANNKLTRRR